MPDLTGFPALDVAIGLAFLFFLLSTICSAINEGIAAVLGWRAKTLEDAVASMVGDPNVQRRWLNGLAGFVTRRPEPNQPGAEDPAPSTDPLDQFTHGVFEHPAIQSLVRNPQSRFRRRSRPSYIPPDVLSLAVVETAAARGLRALAKDCDCVIAGVLRDTADTPWVLADHELLDVIGRVVDDAPVKRGLLQRAVANAGRDLEAFRIEIEGAFNDTMERASGWYKRKAQVVILVLAVAVTVSLNVDTVKVATRLWNDQALRTGVAAAAVKAVPDGAGPTGASAVVPAGSSGPTAALVSPTELQSTAGDQPAGPTGPTGAQGTSCQPVTGVPGAVTDPSGCVADRANAVGNGLEQVDALQLPLGWGNGNDPDWPGSLPGWLLTIVALSLGAPFWFDLLNRLARLRSTGVPASPDTSGTVGQPQPATSRQADRQPEHRRGSRSGRGTASRGRDARRPRPRKDPPR